MRFKYTVASAQGRIERGKMDAPTAAKAAERIRSMGLSVVSLRRDGGGLFAGLMDIGWVAYVDKVAFAKHMALMVKAGLPIDEAVRVLADQSTGRFRKTLTGVLSFVESGRQLSEGLARFPRIFSEFFVATVRAGESSGTLERSLEDLAVQMTKSYELQRKIRGAMTYPVMVLVAAAGIGMGLAVFVLPKMVGLFDSATVKLPLSTRILLEFSKFMASYGALAGVAFMAAVLVLSKLLRSKVVLPFSDALLLKTPVFGKLARNYNLATFSRTMGTMLKSGIPIGEALGITSDTIRNVSYKRALERVRQGTETGRSVSVILEEFPDLFPTTATRMLAVGERSGKFEETFAYLAEFYEDEVEHAAANLSVILEPVLLIFIGLVVAYVAIAVIAPIYGFVGNIGRL